MNRNILATLSEAVEEIEGSNYNHNHNVVLLHSSPTTNHPYTSDEEVGDDGIGLAGTLDLQANVTGIVKLHQHDSESEDEEQVQEKRKVTKEKGEIEHEPLRMTELVKKNLAILLNIFLNF